MCVWTARVTQRVRRGDKPACTPPRSRQHSQQQRALRRRTRRHRTPRHAKPRHARAQDVSGGLPVRVQPVGGGELPLWGMQIDLEQARSELRAAVAGGGTAGVCVCVCVRARVCVCVCACVRACVCGRNAGR
jgi:hypothetical protein